MAAGLARRTSAPDGTWGAGQNPHTEPEADPRGYLPITGRACLGTPSTGTTTRRQLWSPASRTSNVSSRSWSTRSSVSPTPTLRSHLAGCVPHHQRHGSPLTAAHSIFATILGVHPWTQAQHHGLSQHGMPCHLGHLTGAATAPHGRQQHRTARGSQRTAGPRCGTAPEAGLAARGLPGQHGDQRHLYNIIAPWTVATTGRV